MRKTLVVHNRHALRTYRTRAALDAEQGLQMFTIEQLAARLAGGFLRPIDPDDFNAAVGAALAVPMGELDAIKTLPGFQRAAAASLSKAWTAGVNLAEESESVTDPTAKARLSSLAILEREVLARLPKNQLRPRDLVTAASKHAHHALAIFGRIEIHGRTEMSPIWRPLLSVMVQSTQVVWMAEARRVPDWISSTGIAVERSSTTASGRQRVLLREPSTRDSRSSALGTSASCPGRIASANCDHGRLARGLGRPHARVGKGC